MRTTIDLPDDLHRLATSIARDRRQTLSATVTQLMRRGLQPEADHPDAEPDIRMVDGFPVIFGGRPTTSEDVRALDDE